jgi:hypothetical protein
MQKWGLKNPPEPSVLVCPGGKHQRRLAKTPEVLQRQRRKNEQSLAQLACRQPASAGTFWLPTLPPGEQL